MKRLIFTLITLFTVSLAHSQIEPSIVIGGTEYYLDYAVNENGITFDMYYIYGMQKHYRTKITSVKGPAVIYDIYGHIKYHITDSSFDLNALMQNELQYGAYIVAPYGYKPFKVYNGSALVNEDGKFTPVK